MKQITIDDLGTFASQTLGTIHKRISLAQMADFVNRTRPDWYAVYNPSDYIPFAIYRRVPGTHLCHHNNRLYAHGTYREHTPNVYAARWIVENIGN